jgi:hypothetical protein
VLVSIPLSIVAGMVLAAERLDSLEGSERPLIAPAEVVAMDERVGVVVTPAWTAGPILYAPEWAGLVGHVEIHPGAELRQGDPVVTVSGVTRLAVATPQPFHRSLALGDRGPDVVWLHDVLDQLGHLSQAPTDRSVVSDMSLTAVGALATELGVPGSVDAFDPAWFVWLPVDPYVVAVVELKAGAPAPSAGSPVATSRPDLSSVAVQTLDGGTLPLDPTVDYRLEVVEAEVPVLPDGAVVTNDGLRELEAVLDPDLDSLPGTVRRAKPVDVWAVPSGAVSTGTNGALCVWAETEGGFESIPAEVVAARAGISFVEPVPGLAPRLLLNPATTLPNATCPSV